MRGRIRRGEFVELYRYAAASEPLGQKGSPGGRHGPGRQWILAPRDNKRFYRLEGSVESVRCGSHSIFPAFCPTLVPLPAFPSVEESSIPALRPAALQYGLPPHASSERQLALRRGRHRALDHVFRCRRPRDAPSTSAELLRMPEYHAFLRVVPSTSPSSNTPCFAAGTATEARKPTLATQVR